MIYLSYLYRRSSVYKVCFGDTEASCVNLLPSWRFPLKVVDISFPSSVRDMVQRLCRHSICSPPFSAFTVLLFVICSHDILPREIIGRSYSEHQGNANVPVVMHERYYCAGSSCTASILEKSIAVRLGTPWSICTSRLHIADAAIFTVYAPPNSQFRLPSSTAFPFKVEHLALTTSQYEVRTQPRCLVGSRLLCDCSSDESRSQTIQYDCG